jgi:hypothetical protein
MTELDQFDLARKKFGGTRRGLETEFSYFCKCHKDWKAELPKLTPAIEKEWQVRSWLKANNRFCAPWKNFKTWIYNRCWEQEWPEYEAKQRQNQIPEQTRQSEPILLGQIATEAQKKLIRQELEQKGILRKKV